MLARTTSRGTRKEGLMEAGTTAAPAGRAPDREGPLRRAIGRRMLLFFILGDILGAGIYALVGEVGGEIGGAVWVAFTVGLVLALCTAFAYAELVTKYPHAGGAALYINHAFKRPFLTFMVAFAVMASGVTSASTLARAFAGDYLEEFVSVPTTLAALVFIGIVALINFRGISESVKTNMVLTVVELTGLLIIILIGLWVLGNGDGEIGRNFEFKEGENVFVAILAGTMAGGILVKIGAHGAVYVAVACLALAVLGRIAAHFIPDSPAPQADLAMQGAIVLGFIGWLAGVIVNAQRGGAKPAPVPVAAPRRSPGWPGG